MNFSELQHIIKHLKKAVECHSCKKKFLNENMQVISTFQNEALLQINCFHCHSQLLVHVAIVNNTPTKNQRQHKSLNIQTQQTHKISQNEVLDMHNFLNQFNGDFKKLFTI